MIFERLSGIPGTDRAIGSIELPPGSYGKGLRRQGRIMEEEACYEFILLLILNFPIFFGISGN